MIRRSLLTVCWVSWSLVASTFVARADDHELLRFARVPLTDTYFSEGGNVGDFDRDGKLDAVHGPYWWAGPEFNTRHEIYPPKPQNRDAYADNFFTWVHDFDGDGASDLLCVGLPGSPAVLYQNPGPGKLDQHWKKTAVFDGVGNESPQFVNLVGDERPELVCNRGGRFGYATPDWTRPLEKWSWQPISEQIGQYPFGHGLGVGDVNGDGRPDVLYKDGWFEQPEKLDGATWPLHKFPFAGPGGADMFAYDVDGDGDRDVITSLAAHTFGLAWFEQVREDGAIAFRKHVIVGDKPEQNRYGVLFSEPHAVALADIDGDGLQDIVTGKTYWSHHRGSPLWDAGAVVYWFQLVRSGQSVDWVPHLADGDTGIGRQLTVADVDGDKRPDLVVGGMKGAHVLLQRRAKATNEEWLAAQPKPLFKPDGTELTPIADGLAPEEAAKRMTAPPGLQVQLAAGEPLVHQPVAFTIDARGRLWVAEAYTYPLRAKEGEGRDKIVILEDKDGDGRFETRKVFAEGLNLVSGLELGFGGVLVGAAPYLLFLPDRNGDDMPDGPSNQPAANVPFPKDVPAGATVLLDGFGWQDTHETLNSLIWGPDGWLYGCHGVFTHSRVGRPGTPDEQRTPLNAGIWRFHPVRREFEVFAWGTSNPWGVDFNDHGQAFATACVIPHLWHVIQGARYQRQAGQHFDKHAYDVIGTIADHPHYVGNIRDHAWWGHEPKSPVDTLAAGGGHAHAGAMIYLGGSLPDSYRNQIFMCNIHGNRVNQDRLVPRGSGYVGQHGRDLLVANDRWFRGIALKYGPDGSVFVIDWYDKNACHRVNPGIWDRTNGRIYKVSAKSSLAPPTDAASLTERLLHANDFHGRLARRQLHEQTAGRQPDPKLQAELRTLAFEHADDARRLRGAWTLHVYGGLAPEDVLRLLADKSPYVRGWAIQLALESRQPAAQLLAKLVELAAHDPSPVVRLYLASALQRLAVADRAPIAEALSAHAEDANDPNLPLMLWYGLEPLVAADPARGLVLAEDSKLDRLSRFIIRRAASDAAGLNVALEAAARADAARQQRLLDEIAAALEGRVNVPQPDAWRSAYEALSKSTSAAIRDRADQLAVTFGDRRILPRFRELLVDPQTAPEKRRYALDLIVAARDKESVAALQAVVARPDLRGPAIRALAGFDDPKTPAVVLAEYVRLNDDEKRDAITTLCSRPAYALALLDAMAADKAPRTDLHAYHVQQLLRFEDSVLQGRLKAVWGEFRVSPKEKQEAIAKLKSEVLPRLPQADLSNGRRLFTKTCANCHKLFGEGTLVGPDITGANRASLDYLLENVLDPSAIVGKDYRQTLLQLSDGRVVSGLVMKETDSGLTMRTINDTVLVAKADIESRKLSELSMMPDRLLETLKPDEVRDLLGYLGSPSQIVLRGPRPPFDAKTGRVPGALEGERLKIVRQTGGAAGSQAMGGFAKDKWSGASHVWWTGAKPGDELEFELPAAQAGTFAVELVLTRARDYGIVQLMLNGESLGGPIDLFNDPDVITTGVLTFDARRLPAGVHKLTAKIVGANPRAVKAFMFGLDYVRLVEK